MWGEWSAKLSRLGATCNYSAAGHLSQSTFKLCPSKSEEAPARQLVKGLAMLHWLVFFLHPVISDMYAGSYDIHSYVF